MLHTDRFHDYCIYIYSIYSNSKTSNLKNVSWTADCTNFKSFLPVSFYFTFDFLFPVKAFHKIEI